MKNLSLLVMVNTTGLDPKDTSTLELITQKIKELQESQKVAVNILCSDGISTSNAARIVGDAIDVKPFETPALANNLMASKATVFGRMQQFCVNANGVPTMIVVFAGVDQCSIFPTYYGGRMGFEETRMLDTPTNELSKGSMILVFTKPVKKEVIIFHKKQKEQNATVES